MSFDVKFSSKTEALQAVRSLVSFAEEHISDENHSAYVRQQLYALHTLLFHVPEAPKMQEVFSLSSDEDSIEIPF